MARFCFYCGRALLKGEKCTCPAARDRAGPAARDREGPAAGKRAGPAARDREGKPAGDEAQAGRPDAANSPGGDTGSTRRGPGRSESTGRGTGSAGNAGSSGRGTGLLARWHTWRRKREMDRQAASQSNRRQAGPGNQRAGAGQAPGGKPRWANPFSKEARGKARYDFMMQLPSIMTRLLKAGRYIIRPVDAIRLSVQYPAIKRTLGFLAVLAATSGLVFQSAVRNPQLAQVSGNFTTAPRLLLFVEGMAFGAASMMLLALFYRLTILFLHRHNYSYQSLFDALSPASLYGGLALLFGFFALQTSLFSAVTVLSVGLGINYLVQYPIIRQLTNMDENHSFMIVMLANLLCTSAMGVLISLF